MWKKCILSVKINKKPFVAANTIHIINTNTNINTFLLIKILNYYYTTL